MDIGKDLYEVMHAYAALGEHHRTGTDEDARTLDWFEDRVRARGGTTERQPWSFDRYDAEWRVTVDGTEVAALPLFYEGLGEVASAEPFVGSVTAVPAGRFSEWTAVTERARVVGTRLAVVATESPSGFLVAPNRSPAPPGSGLPTLLVAGALGARLPAASVRARLTARLVPGRSANVIGRIGPGPDHERLRLTTPLSGWFRCAGERGTGIAVMPTSTSSWPLLPLTRSGTASAASTPEDVPERVTSPALWSASTTPRSPRRAASLACGRPELTASRDVSGAATGGAVRRNRGRGSWSERQHGLS